MTHRLFLRWALLNSIFAVILTAGAILFHSKVDGASAYSVPAILALFIAATAYGGRLCWRVDTIEDRFHLGYRAQVLHDSTWLARWAYSCQVAGIIATLLGFYIILNQTGDGSLSEKLAGGKVALLGSLVGVVCSQVILVEHWLLEHELGRR